MIKVEKSFIEDLICLTPKVFNDDRGYFFESWNKEKYIKLGIHDSFVQDNHSVSTYGVIRGLHYQILKPQSKLVRVISGEIYDVAIDLRKNSKTFGKWDAKVLSSLNKKQFWIPEGFAHGFLVLSEKAEVLYKATNNYFPEGERKIIWSDKTLNIKWPKLKSNMQPSISDNDARGELFQNAEYFI